MTLTFTLDLDILPLDLHAEIQVFMSVRLAKRVVTHGHTDRQTHDVKTITPVADAGCNKHMTGVKSFSGDDYRKALGVIL